MGEGNDIDYWRICPGKIALCEQHYVQRDDRQEVLILDGTRKLASDSKITWATENTVETLPGKQTEQPTGRQTAGPQVIVNHLHRLYPGAAATGNRSGGNDRAFLQGTSGLHSDL